MGLLDLFTKLVVEHGSAEVQSKHIALFKDQLALADKKISELETENATLKSQLNNSEMTIQKLASEHEKLRSEIQEYEKPTNKTSHADHLEEIKVNILLLLSKYEALTASNVASTLKIGVQTATFHLEELFDSDLISASYSTYEETSWYLAQAGRKYLVLNKLIT